MINSIRKRNGEIVPFDPSKMADAISKAFCATGSNMEQSKQASHMVALAAVSILEKNLAEGSDTVTVEDAQDACEQAIDRVDFNTAKAFILYRQSHKAGRNIDSAADFCRKVEEGFTGEANDVTEFLESDVSKMQETERQRYITKKNSNGGINIGTKILNDSESITKEFWLDKYYDAEIADAYRNSDIHIHDLGFLGGYCAGWSLKTLIKEGLGGVPNKISSGPAKHLGALCLQMVNFLGILQNEWAGAQAFSSVDTLLAPFIKKDNLNYAQVKQATQELLFGLNIPGRWGSQAPFTNFTIDWICPEDMRDLPAIVGGVEQDFTYGDCQPEMDIWNKAFIEVIIQGDVNGRGFQYPIPTYSITKDFNWGETENNKLLFEMASKYGTPYFSNYVNSDMKPSDVRSMCPLYGKQDVLVMDDYSKEFHISSIENLYNGNKADKTYTVLLHGQKKLAALHRFEGLDFYNIVLSNGQEVSFSGNHDNLTLRGIVKTEDLTDDDYLPFETVETDGEGLTFEDGFMVGTFMGDGTVKDEYSVTYSLNNTSKAAVMDEIVRLGIENYGAKVSICDSNKKGTCTNVTLTSKMLRGLVEDYISGKALNKEINCKAINRSIDFRRGLIEGLMATDGNQAKRRIYTASANAVKSITAIFASLGIPASVNIDNRDATETYSDNPVYCIRPYKVSGLQTEYSGVYKKTADGMWFKIKSIKKMDTASSVGYCFEVLNDDRPYFMMPNGLITHNCRLRLDLRELQKQNGGNFGAGENTGSIGVVTINMPRIAYLSANEDEFFTRLEKMMDISARSLNIKRKVITKYLEMDMYPYTKRYLPQGFKNHFSTIGLVGMNEACLNAKWIGKDLSNPEAYQWTAKVLDFMRNKLSDYQELYGNLFNLEATPAESTAYRFARRDKKIYPDIITAGKSGETPYYTNSSHLPVGFTSDIFDALDIQDNLQIKYTSGTVFHAFLGEKLPDWKAAANLVKTVADNYKLPYFTLSPVYSICPDHGYLTGEQKVCPICGKRTEVYSRITGYYRPVANWNDGKQQEFEDRKAYVVSSSKFENSAEKEKEEPKEEPKTEEVTDKQEGMKLYFFTTRTCPNCKMVKATHLLDKFDVKEIDAEADENKTIVQAFCVMQAPTLVVVRDGKAETYVGAGPIIGFARKY